MTSRCDHILELLVAEATGAGPWSESVAAHLGGCEACAAQAKRLRLHRRALSELRPVPAPAGLEKRVLRGFSAEERTRRVVAELSTLNRLEAPATLDGKVVAASNGGVRQDRAVSELSVLDARRASRELDRRLETVFSELRDDGLLPQPHAPQALEERVDHDLHDLPAALTRHFVGKLERLTAPPVLARRVDEELRRQPAGRLIPFRHWSIASAAAVVAGVALWIGFQNTGGPDPPDPTRFAERSVEIVHLEDLSGLSPAASTLADSVSGGAYRVLSSLPREALPREALDDPAAALQTVPSGGRNTSPAGGSSSATPPSRGSGGSSLSTSNGTAPTIPRTSSNGRLGSAGGPSFLDLVPDAPFITAYRGERRVLDRLGFGQVVDFEVIELVASDGQGLFTVEVLDVASPPMPQYKIDEHALLQSNHIGFSYRHRDFRIRDLQRFWQNYLVVDTGNPLNVAGRNCAVLEARRHDGRGNRFIFAVDPVTGLVMRHEEYRPDGSLVRKVWFETFQLDADLSDLQLSGGPSQWVEIDPDQPGALGFDLLPPTAPPTGFLFDSAGVRSGADPSGATWARFVYGDGVRYTFFMHSDASLKPNDPAIVGKTNDRIRVVQFGAWTVAEGLIRGRHLLAIGKVDEQELLLMMQSAIE